MLIEVQGLSKRYRPRGPMVVEEISFTIDRGETLAIFGDSGSGKSTIGQILAGIYPATAGEVRLDGQRLSYPLRKGLMSGYAQKLADQVDVILFAQGSMAYCEGYIHEKYVKVVLSSPRFGAAALKAALVKKGLL